MNTKTLIAVVALAVVIVAAALVLTFNNNDAPYPEEVEEVSAVVWIDVSDEYVAYEGSGTNVQEILKDALGDDVVFGSNGNVLSFDGTSNGDDGTWVMFRWTSYPLGWTVVQGNYRPVEGTQLALEYSQRTIDENGTSSYTTPDKDIEMEVWFFIQFAELEDIAAMSGEAREMYMNMLHWIELMGLNEQTLIEGFWIKGTGDTNNEALANAVMNLIKTNYPELDDEVIVNTTGSYIQHYVDGELMFSYGTNQTMYGWFLSFLGWSDFQMGELYLYWSQYSYSPASDSLDDPNYWGYNNFSFGMYDITEYHYFALVLQTTAAADSDDAYFIDIPAPSTVPA